MFPKFAVVYDDGALKTVLAWYKDFQDAYRYMFGSGDKSIYYMYFSKPGYSLEQQGPQCREVHGYEQSGFRIWHRFTDKRDDVFHCRIYITLSENL